MLKMINLKFLNACDLYVGCFACGEFINYETCAKFHRTVQLGFIVRAFRTAVHLKDIYSCPFETIKELLDKGQFKYLTWLKGPQEGTYLSTTQFLSLR